VPKHREHDANIYLHFEVRHSVIWIESRKLPSDPQLSRKRFYAVAPPSTSDVFQNGTRVHLPESAPYDTCSSGMSLPLSAPIKAASRLNYKDRHCIVPTYLDTSLSGGDHSCHDGIAWKASIARYLWPATQPLPSHRYDCSPSFLRHMI
jgi:hypothetical protein